MEWITAVIGLSGTLFITYSIPLIIRALNIWKLRKDYINLPVTPIYALKNAAEGRYVIKGVTAESGDSLSSLFDDTKGVFFRTKIYPRTRKKFAKSWLDKRAINFKIKDKKNRCVYINAETALSEYGRFLIFHREIQQSFLVFAKKELLPERWRDKLEYACALEEYLTVGKSISIIGHFKTINGKIELVASKNKPFVIAECSDEAFALLHLRFFVRIALLALSMALTGLLQLYMLFFAMQN